MPNPIQTTQGPVDVADLGPTLVHEHLLTAHEGVRFQWPHLVDAEGEHQRAVESVQGVQAHGIQTICDPSCLDLCRDVRLNLAVGEATGMRFVMATGVYGHHYTSLPHFFQTRDADVLAGCFVHDLTQGIQATEVKAHFLKCAADEPGMTPDVTKVHEAVAKAHAQTGAPVMAHTRPASKTGPQQVEVLQQHGVDPSRILLAHCGDTDDLDHLEELVELGVLLGMDRYGLDLFLPEEQRNATVQALVERGYADRLVLGQDYCATIDWYPDELKPVMAPRWSMTVLFEESIPTLKELGVGEGDIDAMLGANVHRWLSA